MCMQLLFQRKVWLGYVLALTLTAMVLLLRKLLRLDFAQNPTVDLYLIPIVVSAYVGGLGPGLAATAFAALGTLLFIMLPVRPFFAQFWLQAVQWIGLLVGGCLITVVMESLHRARQKAEHQGWLFHYGHDAVLVWERDERILFWNSEAERLYGFPRAEAVGRRTRFVLKTEGLDPLLEELKRGGRAQGEVFHTTRGGRVLTVETHMVAIREGRRELVLEVNRDITERKRTLQTLRAANQDLQQFAYAAAHDLQEPLRNVATSLGLLQRSCRERLGEEGSALLRESIENALHMHRLVQDLLAFSRIADGAEQPHENADAHQIALQVIGNARSAVSETGGAIQCGSLPVVAVRETHLTQLLQHLVGNGLKYQRPGIVPHIDISARRHGNYWQFAVADNGIGFDPAFAERVFGVFKRLHNADQYPGTGIGLAICDRIVKLYGGRIWAEGRPGQGATFFFTLPPPAGS